MTTISCINLKGGVAKTISAVNIAHILATVHGKRVLLIDNDKQGNTSRIFGLYDYEHPSVAELMLNKNVDVAAITRGTQYERLSVIPSNMGLLEANKKVLLDTSRIQQLCMRKALATVAGDYDYCVIDNPPDINISVINALAASNDVIVPIKIDSFAFDGIDLLSNEIEAVRDYNPGICFRGCFVTLYQNNSVNRQGSEWLDTECIYPMFKTRIRKTTKVDESTFANMPLLEYAKNSTATKDYLALVDEYLKMTM